MQETTQPAEQVVETAGVTKFGFGQLSNPTPMWVKWTFRVEFLLNKAFGVWMASQSSLSLEELKNLVLWATIIDGFVWGLGKFVGISKDDIEK